MQRSPAGPSRVLRGSERHESLGVNGVRDLYGGEERHVEMIQPHGRPPHATAPQPDGGSGPYSAEPAGGDGYG